MSDAHTVSTTRRAPVPRPGRPKQPTRSIPNGPSAKVRRAIEYMVFGTAEDGPVARKDAAKLAGLADETLRKAFANPAVVKHYNSQLEVLRTSARPRALHKIERLSEKAVSERVQLDAAKYLDGGDRSTGVTVNVGIQNLQPGYAIAVPQDYADGARQMLKLSGSHANVLDLQADVPTDEPGTR